MAQKHTTAVEPAVAEWGSGQHELDMEVTGITVTIHMTPRHRGAPNPRLRKMVPKMLDMTPSGNWRLRRVV